MDVSPLFVSHGSPMMVLEDTPARRFLQGLGAQIGKPKAVLAVSAHWLTRLPTVGFAARPGKIDDMYGFPAELYQMVYAPPGMPALAARVAALLGPTARQDPDAGIDHGIWSVMSLIWPDADVPVVPLSVQPEAGARHHYDLGRRLRPLVEDGVLILGTGAATHNLNAYFGRAPTAPADPAMAEFTGWMADAIEAGRIDDLLDYRRLAPHAVAAHPTEEHLLPLFTALGAAAGGRGKRLHHGMDCGVLAMDAYGFYPSRPA